MDSRIREIVRKNLLKPSQDMFDEAQKQAYTLMAYDSFPRFIESQTYKKLIGQKKLSRTEGPTEPTGSNRNRCRLA